MALSFDDARTTAVVQLPSRERDENGGLRRHWRKLSDWLKSTEPSATSPNLDELRPGMVRRWSKRVVTELPRPPTFKRQLSERRERLAPHEPSRLEPRAVSVDRRRAASASGSPDPPHLPEIASLSTTAIISVDDSPLTEQPNDRQSELPPPPSPQPPEQQQQQHHQQEVSTTTEDLYRYVQPPRPLSPSSDAAGAASINDPVIAEELDRRWILNLSMHFRDRSDREKFFVNYAETTEQWRRLTISCDYRNAPADSLEEDLKGLRYQQDKSARIYEAIRDSLPDIKFYDTVTNLKLQTSDGRLHVHVTEDLNERIDYPAKSLFEHVLYPLYRESAVAFESHLSGFVYKVRVDGRVMVKKEIPGPDAIDEFVYEVNALAALSESSNVIPPMGLVVDDETGLVVKGLLVRYAERGNLGDIIYNAKGSIPWQRRIQWARGIVQGLVNIHDAGFVQGDLTLSNIVVDGSGEIYIIDINRRGCPVGWEPPEMEHLIAHRQKVGMYIGVKSDVFQLGMALWAIATLNDEPELEPRPLTMDRDTLGDDIPVWFERMILLCLFHPPSGRMSAIQALDWFPKTNRSRMDENGRSIDHGCDDVVDDDDDDDDGPSHRNHRHQEKETTDQISAGVGVGCSEFYVHDGRHTPAPSTNTGYGSQSTRPVSRGRTGDFHHGHDGGRHDGDGEDDRCLETSSSSSSRRTRVGEVGLCGEEESNDQMDATAATIVTTDEGGNATTITTADAAVNTATANVDMKEREKEEKKDDEKDDEDEEEEKEGKEGKEALPSFKIVNDVNEDVEEMEEEEWQKAEVVEVRVTDDENRL